MSESVALDTTGDRTRLGAGSPSRIALVAVTLTLSLQVSRVFLPMVFDLGERSGTTSSATKAGALALLVFLTPVLAPLVRRVLGPRRAIVVTLVGLIVARLAIQAVQPVPLWLSTAAMVVALLGLTLLLHAMKESPRLDRGAPVRPRDAHRAGHRHCAPSGVLVVGLRMAG